MSTYDKVLNQVQSLPLSDQIQLLEELKNIVHQPVEVNGDDEVIPVEEIAESEAAWQDYLAWQDSGLYSKELKFKLFGKKID